MKENRKLGLSVQHTACGYDMVSYPLLLLHYGYNMLYQLPPASVPYLLHNNGLHLHAVSQNKPFLKLLLLDI